MSKKKTSRFFGFTPKKIVIILGIFISIGLIVFLKIMSSQTKPVIESPHTEMKRVPRDVKRAIKLQPTPATTSAQLRIPILMYHYVENVEDKQDTIRQSLNINPSAFEEQVKTLSDAGYTFMTAKELGEVIDGKEKLPKKPVILTFDDGHWDFDTVILPILKKYKAKSTAYLISSFIGGSDFLSKIQLQDIIKSGLVDVGGHTVHHVSLTNKFLPVVKSEVEQSKIDLEKEYGIKVVSFAYPNGAFDQQAIEVVKEAGFTTAVSTIKGIDQSNQNRFYLYRLRPGYRVGQVLLDYLEKEDFSPR